MMKILITVITLLISQISLGGDMWPFGKKALAVEKQISQLKQCGIEMNASATTEDLFMWGDRNQVESKPFGPIVEALASEIEREPFTPLSDTLWMCDYERIEGEGSYAGILERLELMTGKALNLTNISDYVDFESGQAWVEFDYKENRIRWDASVDGDWMDPYIVVKYDRLLKESESNVRIYSNHTDYGQAALFAAFTPAEYQCFKKLSPIDLELIENQT